MTKKFPPPPFAPIRGTKQPIQAKPAGPAGTGRFPTTATVQAKVVPKLFAPPPLASMRSPADKIKQSTSLSRPAIQAKLSSPPAVSRNHACPGCQPHSPRVLQRMQKSSQGFSFEWDAKENTKSGFKTNSLVAFETSGGEYIELGTASNYTSTNEHAEDVAIRTLQNNIDMFEPGRRTKIFFHLTASPCTSTARNGLPVTGKGCAETLVAYFGTGVTHNVGGQNYGFDLTIFCTGLYAPRIPGVTQSDILEASQAAVDYLDQNGITVSGNVRPGRSSRFEID